MNKLSIDCLNEHFLAVYAQQLHLYERERFSIGNEEAFFIQWRTKAEKKEYFWKLVCKEIGDDHQFFIETTLTPEPFIYTTSDAFYPNQFAIHASSYRQADIAIQKVYVIGFVNEQRQIIQQIVLQFAHTYIHLQAGPLVDITISEGNFNVASIHKDLMVIENF